MATATEQTDIAVLKTKMESALKGIETINTKLDNQTALYLTRTEFDEFKKRWFLSHTLSGIAGSILTGVIIYIITHFGQ